MSIRVCLAALFAAALALDGSRAAAPRFYADDPIRRDPETQDASKVAPSRVSQQFDFVENSFLDAGDRTPMRAVNVNTIDQVPESSWYAPRALSVPQIVAGPARDAGPAPGPWTITDGKSEGITPGLTMKDAAGVTYFVKFDPPTNPEMASGAEIISTKLFHALGYHVPENHLATLRRDQVTIASTATVLDRDGRKRVMKPRDLDDILKKAAKNADGSYRVIASRALEGTPLGHFRYHGTRPDDPNDIFAHEHRRELRGLSVFAAWLNHDDSRSVNTLDTRVNENGRSILRHHLIDFGSTLGSGSTQAQAARAGNEYLWEKRPTFITMLTLGFYVRPWIKVDYKEYPAVGRFEANYFLPQQWKPEYKNPAFLNARPDDRFWAAHLLSKIPDEAIKSVVATAQYSDSQAADYMVEVLLARKLKVLQAWLTGTNPIVDLALSASGALTFQNAAEAAGVAPPAEQYTIAWARFDNATATSTPVGDPQTVKEKSAQAPRSLLDANPEFIEATVRAVLKERPEWNVPVTVHFRRAGGGWQLVGLTRGM